MRGNTQTKGMTRTAERRRRRQQKVWGATGDPYSGAGRKSCMKGSGYQVGISSLAAALNAGKSQAPKLNSQVKHEAAKVGFLARLCRYFGIGGKK